MRDRIHLVMERENMNQQEFSKATGIAAASLSSIFTGRTSPTLKHAEALHQSFPNLNMSWLLFGDGEMMIGEADQQTQSASPSTDAAPSSVDAGRVSLASDALSATPSAVPGMGLQSPVTDQSTMHIPHPEALDYISAQNAWSSAFMKKTDIKPRKIAEIRIFFDDGTYEVFPGNG